MSFCDLPPEYMKKDSAKIVILPVPYDGTSTGMKGADKGPQAIFDASMNLELYDIETDSEVYKEGIYTAPLEEYDPDPEKMSAQVEEKVSRYLKEDKFVAVIGGEHSVSIGAIKATAKQHPGMSVLQLDAHTDMREDYKGSRYNHACVMARAGEICPSVQVGIRSMDISEKDKGKYLLAQDIVGNKDWIDDAVGQLKDKVYITLDLDVFDPSIMPSTGTPEPGGMSWYGTLEFLKRVFKEKDVVGFDIVELCPKENDKAPDFLAAKLIYKMLSYRFR